MPHPADLPHIPFSFEEYCVSLSGAYKQKQMKKIVIAIDSFKGCLHSLEAGKAAEKGIKTVFPTCETRVLPVSDGGEGLLDTLVTVLHGHFQQVRVHNPLMEPIESRYGISGDGKTAIIEMAAASGLPLVPEDKRNPLLTTTYGTGELIHDALDRGCRHFIVGIGGSATNDAGVGLLQALGFRFINQSGQPIGKGGGELVHIKQIDTSSVHPALEKAHFTIACDVQNPFCGPNGAAYVYAPQKGATPEMVQTLDKGMRTFAKVIHTTTGYDITNLPGAGAAGGLGGGMLAFLHAELKAGIQLVLETLHFKEAIQDADLIFTGEGQADRQTTMGKVPAGILAEARKMGIPVILIAGKVVDSEMLLKAGFQGVFSIVPGPMSLHESMQPDMARENIQRLVTQICSLFTLQNFGFRR